MNEHFVIVDLETTSKEPEDAHIIEWAIVGLELSFFDSMEPVFVSSTSDGLIKPPVKIPPETSAIHQIIDENVADAPAWEEKAAFVRARLRAPGAIAVAHNADYERAVLARHGVEANRWLCTWKAALRVWPEAPSHSNEALRYYLGHGIGRAAPQAPHTALHDATVTSLILCDLLQKASAADMIAWTSEPAMLPRCPLGDWRNRPWGEVDASFLYWIIRKIDDRPDVVFCARAELARREQSEEPF